MNSPSPTNPEPSYRITLRPRKSNVPAANRVRRLLKLIEQANATVHPA